MLAQRANPKKLLLAMPSEDSVYIDFIGRAPELVELSTWFQQPTNKRLLLAGDGGKGKSALAYKFAAEKIRHHDQDLDAVMWLSAKKRRFQDGRTISITDPDFADLDSALVWMLSQYGSTLLADTLDRKRAEVLRLLNEFPSLIVVDDIDSVLDETAVVEFFTFDVPTTKSRVLLTSRREIPGIRTLLVKGFSQQEAARHYCNGVEPAIAPGFFSSTSR